MIKNHEYTTYQLHYPRDSVTIRATTEEKTNVLVIEMINLFSFQLPPIMLRDREWIKKFDHVIVNNAYEGPLKMFDQTVVESRDQQPVYEFLMAFYNEFKPKTLTYFDNDINTNYSFLNWCRFMKISNPPFVAKYIPNIHFSCMLLRSIAKAYKEPDVRNFFLTKWKQILPETHTTLYWSYNRRKRWGRVFIFYLLQKSNLLDKGIVSMHLSHLNSRFINIAKKIGIDVTQQDLVNLNSNLPKIVDSGIVVSKNPSDLPSMRNDETLAAAINVCTETHFFEPNLFFTEKTLKPILFRQVVLPVASYNICHTMTELYGFKFSPITYKIDRIKNPKDRLLAVIDALNMFDQYPDRLEQELQEVKLNWDHNLKILVDHCDETQHDIITRMIDEIITDRI